MTNKIFRQALAGAWIFVVSLAVTACASVAPASSASPGFTGYGWQVVAIDHGGMVTRIPERVGGDLQFWPGGQFGANDGVNSYSGTYRTTGDGFTADVVAGTANGYAGNDPAILLSIRAMQSFGGGARATVSLTGDRLVVDVGSYTLTCHRSGLPANAPAPTSTG